MMMACLQESSLFLGGKAGSMMDCLAGNGGGVSLCPFIGEFDWEEGLAL